jgi:hypothetical protein
LSSDAPSATQANEVKVSKVEEEPNMKKQKIDKQGVEKTDVVGQAAGRNALLDCDGDEIKGVEEQMEAVLALQIQGSKGKSRSKASGSSKCHVQQDKIQTKNKAAEGVKLLDPWSQEELDKASESNYRHCIPTHYKTLLSSAQNHWKTASNQEYRTWAS